MKLLKLALFSFLTLAALNSCTSQPGEFNRWTGVHYNNVDLNVDQAYAKTVKMLTDNKKTIISNDTVSRVIVVKYFDRTAKITFSRLTKNSSRFDVKALKVGVIGAEASSRVVYNDVFRALNK